MITLYYRRSSLHLPQEAKSLMALGTTDGCFCVMIYSSVHFFNYLRPSEKTFLRTWILNLELDFLIKAFTAWRRAGWGSLRARPFLLLPWKHKNIFQIFSVKVKGLLHVKTTLKKSKTLHLQVIWPLITSTTLSADWTQLEFICYLFSFKTSHYHVY